MLRTLILAVGAACGMAQAENVYVFGTGNASVDQAYVNVLTGLGHTVTVGAQWNAFDGSIPLTGFDVVLMNHAANWSGGSQSVSTAGQQQLVDFVSAGGGLITTEWIVYNNGVSGGLAYSTLMPILPVTYGNTWNSVNSTTMTQVVADPIMNAGLPLSFLVPNSGFSGNETKLLARPGSSVFYDSSNLGPNNAGVTGWQSGAGRVISFSTMPGVESLNDANYARLLANSVSWVGVPSPGAATLIGLAGLAALRRRRAGA